MKGIQTCLWFDNEAREAAQFYVSLFSGSRIARTVPYGKTGAEGAGMPEGSDMVVEFELAGQSFLGLNGGPHFRPNPAISFFVGCESVEEIDELWGKLAKTVRMELGKYPFGERYGWCEDRFGVSWQLMLGHRSQKIIPSLLFVGEKFGKAEEAIHFYVSRFPGSKIEKIWHDEKTKSVLHSVITLAGRSFIVMEGAGEHRFDFTPGTSFVIQCDSQQEIDEIWGKLSAVPEAEQCGWLKDKYGVSWQVTHKDWGKTLGDADPAKRERIMAVVLGMKKPDLKKLQEA